MRHCIGRGAQAVGDHHAMGNEIETSAARQEAGKKNRVALTVFVRANRTLIKHAKTDITEAQRTGIH